jgi:hypothetical protein
MTIRMNYQGIEIFASSPEEAAALIRDLTTGQRIVPKSAPAREDERWATTLAFLSCIRDTGSGGAEVNQIMHAMGVRHPKGVGSKSSIVDKCLMERGFSADSVYNNERSAEGRFWRPAPRLSEAIEAVRSKLEEDEAKRLPRQGP